VSYAAASDVAGHCQNILDGTDNFTMSTCPTLSDVNAWLSSGCSIIETVLTANRYSVPPASSTSVYGWLRDLNALFGAARAEMSRSNVTLAPGERTRGQVFLAEFWSGVKQLTTLDLTGVGLSRSGTGTIYTGGISIAAKDAFESDSDRVSPRFRRGMFDFPDSGRPGVTGAS